MSQTKDTQTKNAGNALFTANSGSSALSGQGEMEESVLSQPVKQTAENSETIVYFTVNPNEPVPPIDWTRFDAITEEELQAAIDSDPDAAEPTDEEWAKGKTDAELFGSATR